MKYIDEIIKRALKEDIQNGDITTEIFVDKNSLFKGKIISKEFGVLCGIDFAKRCFKLLNKNAKVKIFKKDGQFIKPNDVLMKIISNRTILSAERTALNIIQRLSGIATKTSRFVQLAKPYNVSVFDTRKTTPNLRIMEKYAVICGGGTNHRFGLYDAFMIKDNHIESINNFKEIYNKIKIARKKYPEKEIEIEVQSFRQLKNVIEMDVDVIMLDNMDLKTIEKSIKFIKEKRKDIEIEISGGVDEEKFKKLVKFKPDRISIGALTHSYKSLDISMDIKKIK